MTALPAPPVPADANLSGYYWRRQDVHFVRVMHNNFCGDDEALVALMLLQEASMERVPASSLPDDDAYLAWTSRRTEEQWAALKPKALAGYIKCSDGRLYDPALSAQVMKAIACREARRRASKAAADARWERDRNERRAHALSGRKVRLTPPTSPMQGASDAHTARIRDACASQDAEIPYQSDLGYRAAQEPSSFSVTDATGQNKTYRDSPIEENRAPRDFSEKADFLEKDGVEEKKGSEKEEKGEARPLKTLEGKAEKAAALAERCVAAMGDKANAASISRNHPVGQIGRWIEAGCDPDLDILPLIGWRARKAAPGSIRSLAFFGDDPIRAMAKRTAPVVLPSENPHDGRDPHPLLAHGQGQPGRKGGGSALLRGAALSAEKAQRERAAFAYDEHYWAAYLAGGGEQAL